MKFKTTLTTLTTIIVVAVSAFSQNNNFTPSAAGSFSTFSAPQNLGATINAPEMDQLPAPAPNGLSLYFTSNRAGGHGGKRYELARI